MNLENILREYLRIILAAGVSWLLTEGAIALVLQWFGIVLDPAAKVLIVTVLTGVLKSIDRELHNSGVADKGLARF